MADILPIWRKTLIKKSINQSINIKKGTSMLIISCTRWSYSAAIKIQLKRVHVIPLGDTCSDRVILWKENQEHFHWLFENNILIFLAWGLCKKYFLTRNNKLCDWPGLQRLSRHRFSLCYAILQTWTRPELWQRMWWVRISILAKTWGIQVLSN